MNRLVTFLIPLAILTVSSISCTKEEFRAEKTGNRVVRDQAQPATHHQACGENLTYIKPPVDFLYIWDNTGSQSDAFVNPETKLALANTLGLISSKFDYHIYSVPLIDLGTNDDFLVVDNTAGLSGNALSKLVSLESAPNKLASMTLTAGGLEKGLDRAISVLQNNISNGIFRQNANTIVVIMSNGEDGVFNSSGALTPSSQAYWTEKASQLTSIRDNVLNSIHFRFISIVPHSDCRAGWEASSGYRTVSGKVYNTPYPPASGLSSPVDQSGRPYPDSFDICTTDFASLFDGPNNVIQDVVIKHKYDHLSFSDDPNFVFDVDKLKMRKGTKEYLAVEEDSGESGFKYLGFTTVETRYFPSRGEEKTGHILKLFGDAKVTYSERIEVEALKPEVFYGYFRLTGKPVIDSLVVKINNVTIPQSTENGWEYIGYVENQNIRVQGEKNPSDPHAPDSPAEVQTGFFLKFYGSAIHGSGALLDVSFDPSGT